MPPKQYQQGWVEFYKLNFKVTPAVLIPRPETELLVDEVISLVNRKSLIVNRKNINKTISDKPYTIIDVGTGSGNIAIAIAKNLPTVTIIATDISAKALKVAQANAKFHQVENQLVSIHADLLHPITPKNSASYPRGGKVNITRNPDLIVANLPYIPTARIPYLNPAVKDFEPRIALDGGKDGFEVYRQLFQQLSIKMNQKSRRVKTIPPRKWQPKYLIAEIDYTHGELAVQTALRSFPKAEVEVKKDLAKKQRILTIEF